MQCGNCNSPRLQACQNGLLASVGAGRMANKFSTSDPFHQHRAADRKDAAVAAHQRDTGILDLAAARFTAELPHSFDEMQDAADVRLREQAAVRVDGAAAA